MREADTPLEAKSIEDFCSATAAEKDPYGWAALRALGLATGLRIHDGDTGAFLAPAADAGDATRDWNSCASRKPIPPSASGASDYLRVKISLVLDLLEEERK